MNLFIHINYYFFSYAVVAFVLAFVLSPAAGALAFRLGAVDRGVGRRQHEGVVPRLGGVAIFAALAAPLGFSLSRGAYDGVHNQLAGILAGGAVIFVLGAYDDLRGTTVGGKLTAEVAAALVLCLWGIRIESLSNPFGPGAVHLGLWSVPVTVLWVVVVTNALNLIDGLDGLAAGTGIMIAAFLFLQIGDKDPHLRLALAVFVGALAGFLAHNFPPATIFMGDSGSLFVGFFLAAFSIVSYVKSAAMATVLLPVVAFGLPLVDMAYAVLRRYYRGLPLGQADREHIHHKLLAMGFSRRTALLVLYGMNVAFLGVVLLFLRRQSRFEALPLLLLFLTAVLGLRLLGYVGPRSFADGDVRIFFRARQTRYLGFLVRRFRGEAGRAAGDAELGAALDGLLRDAGFAFATVTAGAPGAERVLHHFGDAGGGEDAVRLEVPVRSAGGVPGRVLLGWRTAVGARAPLAAGEVSRAVAEAVGAYLDRTGAGAGEGRPSSSR